MTNPGQIRTYSYLALGDSYSIGEMVSQKESFPWQVVNLMQEDSIEVRTPDIIAKTGWTTSELAQGIRMAEKTLKPVYDFVTLLIGVNNQYRDEPITDYRQEFEALLKQAILFSGNQPRHVIVISIPDWGATPFAERRDRAQIAKEIDAFNNVNKSLSEKYSVHYFDITPWTRQAAGDQTFIASDGLHPSGKEYRRWAEKIAAYFKANR